MTSSRYASIAVALVLALVPAACAYLGTVPPTSSPSASPLTTVTPSVAPTVAGSPSRSPTLGTLPPTLGTLPPTLVPTPRHQGPRKVPSVIIRTADSTLEVRPHAWCYRDTCADGTPPDPLPSIGHAESVEIEFPISDWEFSAQFTQADQRCPLTQVVQLDKNSMGNWVLEPMGYTDTYRIGISAFSPEWEVALEWGDAFYSFEWTTPRDGPLAVPSAHISLLYLDDDERVLFYGAAMYILDVATAARSAAARLTVTAGNGASLSFDLDADPGCSGSGDLRWYLPDEEASHVAELGPAPFAYDVVLLLDDRTYEAHATWPTPATVPHESSTSLVFSPPLPALQPRE